MVFSGWKDAEVEVTVLMNSENHLSLGLEKGQFVSKPNYNKGGEAVPVLLLPQNETNAHQQHPAEETIFHLVSWLKELKFWQPHAAVALPHFKCPAAISLFKNDGHLSHIRPCSDQ